MASSEPSVLEAADEHADCEPERTALGVLDRLRPPKESDLSRKRAISVNKGSQKKGAYKPPSTARSPKNRGPAYRVKQFPNERLEVRLGKLFCTVCRHEVSLVHSTLLHHFASKKHTDAKEARVKKTEEKKQLLIDGQEYIASSRAEGRTLPAEVLVFRIQCLKSFMSAGVPLAKVDHFRPLLEERGERLTGRQHLADLIPMIRDNERAAVKSFLSSRPVSIIFDGTTTVCEAMAIVVRCVGNDFTVQQRLASLSLAAHSMTGEQVAHKLLSILSIEYQVQPHHLIAAMRDRASVNDVAVRTIRPLYTKLMDVGCFSHTLDHVGDAIRGDDVKAFVCNWIQLFSHSPKSRLEWKAQTNTSICTYSKTRWWSKFQVMQQLHDLFGDVVQFLLLVVPGDSSVVRKRMRENIQDLEMRARIQMQLAVTVEFGKPFADSTYRLEGDGPLCFIAYEEVSALLNFANADPVYLPSTEAVATVLANGNAGHRATWIDFARQCVVPAIEYLNRKFGAGGPLYDCVQAFRAARFCHPVKAHEMRPAVADLDDLARFPFIDAADINSMKVELPAYLAACEDIADVQPLQWWRAHAAQFPSFAATLQKIVLVQPSSAAAERVFSLLENSFSSKQESSLADYIEASLMLQYNHRD